MSAARHSDFFNVLFIQGGERPREQRKDARDCSKYLCPCFVGRIRGITGGQENVWWMTSKRFLHELGNL